ncbi:MAG TPA: cell division protein ZipA C-terminal FtsZ-binding domain-containing protein [Casimicrobiaceae bacterium]|nr:cell division protein ZipA C-terminal FtsZ-binding domain-containing protein [Casimicrobiaceae bacterium]
MDAWLRSVASHPSLFVALVAAGAALIIGVLIYNGMQVRRARQRIERSFGRPTGGTRERAEPTLRRDDEAPVVPRSVAIDETPQSSEEELPDAIPEDMAVPEPAPLAARSARDAAMPDPDIECVVVLAPGAPVATAALARARAVRLGGRARWLGRRDPSLPWQPLDGGAGPWQQIAACLLLADRSGAATGADIASFLSVVGTAASEVSAEFTPPDAGEEAERAEALDRLCADLDVQIGLTLLKSDQAQIAGTRLRGVAEAAGFRLAPGGHFEYLQEDTGAVLCTLQNYKQEPFTAESLRALSTPGVVMIIDVPRVADPVRAFDQMRLTARRLAKTLDAVLVDDNRRPLDDAALSAIRAQIQATATALKEANIDPGGPRALRLFG